MLNVQVVLDVAHLLKLPADIKFFHMQQASKVLPLCMWEPVCCMAVAYLAEGEGSNGRGDVVALCNGQHGSQQNEAGADEVQPQTQPLVCCFQRPVCPAMARQQPSNLLQTYMIPAISCTDTMDRPELTCVTQCMRLHGCSTLDKAILHESKEASP